jgi:inorganic pyrophosphatase
MKRAPSPIEASTLSGGVGRARALWAGHADSPEPPQPVASVRRLGANPRRGDRGVAVNPWHDIEIGRRVEEHFPVVIEIPKGSKIKYELDKQTGLLRLDRVLHSAVHYPANYGFLPQTFCPDDDPLDALVLGQEPVVPLCILRARAIGVITMSDEKGRDDKVVAVHVDDPEYAHYRDVSELPPHRVKELQRFFLDYKVLEHKTVNVEDLRGATEAIEVIHEGIALYRQKIGRA